MLNIKKIPDNIIDDLKNRGHSIEAIQNMTPERAFTEYCEWQGLISWGDSLIGTIDCLREAKSD